MVRGTTPEPHFGTLACVGERDPRSCARVTADGKGVLRLRRPWRDGTRAICFEPSELLEKLAVIIPRPRIPSGSAPLRLLRA